MDNKTSNNYINSPQKGLVTDLDSSLVGPEYWTHMRNGVINSHDGRINFLQNEPSNKFCSDFPYTPIGFIKMVNNRWAVFTTDNTNSEIGIFDESKCTYEKVVNSKCLNFNTSNLIRGAFKESFDCSEVVYWTDGNRNPRRKLNLNNVPHTFTIDEEDACKTKKFTDQLDCDALLMVPKITVPCITIVPGGAGSLENGSYQLAMAYTFNEQRLSEVHSITTPLRLFSQGNQGKSIDVGITGLDLDFPQYELLVIYTIKETTTVKRIGFFNTSSSRHQIVNVNKPEYITLPIEDIVTKRPQYFGADDVVNNDQYLLWSGVTTRPDLNYQKQAMNIKSRFVSYQVPADYYEKGGDKVGYFRDEVYAFAIEWLWDTGNWSSAFHIPGRNSTPDDLGIASGRDVYEVNNNQVRKKFQIYDTSKNYKTLNQSSVATERAILEGDMSYWQSTELYPDNKETFGDKSCTPILHHKMPSEANASRYQPGGSFINILGVKFQNIEHPKDENGNYVQGIVGYRIVRGDREGNRSVVARGMFTNVRSYNETINQQGNSQEVLYPNYPFNDLRADSFISNRQTFFRNSERDHRPLVDFKQDQFNFYSPHTLFGNIALGEEIILETEEYSSVRGYFEHVYNHPRAKVISNFSFYLAILIGAIDGVLSVFGRKVITEIKDGVLNVTTAGVGGASNVTFAAAGLQFVTEAEGIINGLRFKDIIRLPPLEAAAKTALKVLQSAATAGYAAYFAFNTANQVLDTIYGFLPFNDYALQYNSYGKFSNYSSLQKDNKRRHIEYYQYLYDGVNTVQGVTFNNFKREPSVYVRVNDTIDVPSVQDNTRQTIKDLNLCDNPFRSVNTNASVYYGTVKKYVPNQYGQIDSIKYLATSGCHEELIAKDIVGSEDKFYESGIVFGGDAFINSMTVRRSHQFFRQNLSNGNFQDGTEYDYTLYRNVGYPRYWLNTQKYDLSEFIASGRIPNRTPQNKFNLDCQRRQNITTLNLSVATNQYFYLFNSGVSDIFVESEYNLDAREFKGREQNFYSKSYSNLSELFRSDRISEPEEFVYDKSFSKQLTENAIFQQRVDYNPLLEKTCFSYYKNRVIYSLPASGDGKGDNWLIYLLNNYHDFSTADFGNLTAMHSVDNQQVIFLFDKSGPYITPGRDELQTTSGIEITIGDGGLFSREPRPLIYTDYGYGSSQSKWAFVNTQFGSFYPSQRQGRIFRWAGKFEEVSNQGLHWWFSNYLPSKILEEYPTFKHKDNPISGIGLISVFDNNNETYYLSKKDYKIKDSVKDSVNVGSNGELQVNGKNITLGDPTYFDDASWTISYSPRNQCFVSWHDWHPDWLIQGEKHFMSVKNNAIWKHNDRCDSYCNFYNEDKPWEIEFVINNGPNVQILRNIEYVLESGKYFNNCSDFHHILDDNFDTLVVSNSEQSSGPLTMHLGYKNKMSQAFDYPKLTVDGWQIRYEKEENKIRVNEFWDSTKDRGEFTKFNFPLWTTSPNGYSKVVTPSAINVSKSIYQRKRFRHMQNKIFLSKSINGGIKRIFKFNNSKNLHSFR